MNRDIRSQASANGIISRKPSSNTSRTATRRLWATSFHIFAATILALFLSGSEREADLCAVSQKPVELRIPELEKLLSEKQNPLQRWQIKLLLGKSYLEARDYIKAEQVLQSPDLDKSPLHEYAGYFLIQARTGTDPKYFGEKLWQKLYFTEGEASFKIEAAEKLGNNYFNAGKFAEALPYFEALIAAYPENVSFNYKIAKSYDAVSGRDLALPFVQWLYIEAPAAKESEGLFEEFPFFFPEVQKLGKSDILKRLVRLEEQGGALKLEKELPLYEKSLDPGSVNFLKASILASKKRTLEAVDLYLRVDNTSELHMKALERCVQNIKAARGKALDIERKLLAVKTPEKEKLLIRLFDFYKINSMSGDAGRIAKELLAFSNPDAAEFIYKNGWMTYVDGNRKKTVAVFLEMTKLLPPENDYHQAALFSLLEMNALSRTEADAAKAELLRFSRYGYYGYRLRGGIPPARSETNPDLPPILSPPEPLSRRYKASLLAECGLGNEAVAELETAMKVKEKPELLWELALIASKVQLYPKSVRAARKLYPNAYTADGDKLPRQAWEMIYPLPYFESFVKTAEEKEIPAATLYSIARQESLFDRSAVSKAGARGMIQLMPSTAHMVAKKNGIVIPSEEMLNDVDLNLDIGSRYFLSILKMFDSSLPLALAGYNAGPGRPAEWKRRPNSPKEETLFIESIPFKETRSYVKRIMNNIWEYQRIYPELKGK
jgi:soluble lytic murein transglycosylase-like protein/tetratricopeptide (TPR) repeat protein